MIPLQTRRRMLGSFLSALVGLAALIVTWFVVAMPARENPATLLWVAGIGGIFVFGTWLVLLLPLYLLVPATSIFWRWPVMTVCGALAGGGIWLLLAALNSGLHHSDTLITTVVAAITGAATCLFGALTAQLFRNDRNG